MKKLWKNYSYAIILILLSLVSSLILSVRFDAFHQKNYIKVTVSDGDSLWKIADKYSAKQTLSDQAFIQWVQRHNNIDDEHLFPGEEIVIPVSSKTQPVNEFAGEVRD